MDIFDYAMQMENDGKEFYLVLAANAMNQGVKSIFNLLAEEEAKHYLIVKAMKEDKNTQFLKPCLLSDVKNIFKNMKEEDVIFNANISQKEAYVKAQELEKQSEDFYLEQANQAIDNEQKLIFQKIAAEEKQHYWLLDNLIEFITRPDNWLENAEWNHLEEY